MNSTQNEELSEELSMESTSGAQPTNTGWRRYLSTILIIVGSLMLSYVASQYYGMYREQKRLAQEWQQQNSQEQKRSSGILAENRDGLIRVSIPKINLDAIILDGTTRKQLKNGPGRVIGTALPGETGTAVITAHRDTFFRHIYELNKGDSILVQRNGETLRFEVTGKKIVEPDDLSVLKQADDPRLTLITCYPIYYIGPAPQRLVVFAKLADRAQSVVRNQKTVIGNQ
jgi:LPXTG-site transpeptidase (sortase) family protein